MRKLIGIAVGVVLAALVALVVRRLSRPGAKLTPKGVAESVSAAVAELSAAAQAFATDVRQGMAEHAATLREAAELAGGHLGRPATP